MADNFTTAAGAGGDSFGADDIGGIKYERVKIIQGADGTNDGDVSSAAPLHAQLRSEFVDDAAFTPGTSRCTVIGGQLDNTGTDPVDEGDAGALRMAANRCLYVNVRDNAGNERGLNIDASGQLAVTVAASQTIATTNAGIFAVQVDGSALTALQLIDDAIATAGSAITAKGNAICGTDGTNARIVKTDSSGELQVDVLSIASGTNNIGDVDVISLIPGTGASALGKAEDAAHTTADVGVAILAVRRDTAAVGSDTDGDYSTLNVNASGRLYTEAALAPQTSGGLSIFRSLDLDESEEDVKTAAGQVYGWFMANTSAGTRYVKFYNATAANVTVGSTTPVITIPLAAGAAANVEFSQGIAFSTAISVAATTGAADADTGAPSANDVVVNIFYK